MTNPRQAAWLRPTLIRSLSAVLHEVAMEIRTLRGCREAFCFIKSLQGFAKTHVGVLEQRKLHPLGFFFSEHQSRSGFSEKRRQMADKRRQRLRRESSQEWDADAAAIPSRSCRARYICGSSGRLVKTWSRVPQKPDFCLCLSITLLSSSLIKKERKRGSCLCWAEHFFSCICAVATAL